MIDAMAENAVLDAQALALLFGAARSHNGWLARPVSDAVLRSLYEVSKWGPTASNCQPARVIFVRSPEGKARLRPCLAPGNVEKAMSAPVTAIIGYDLAFHDQLPRLFPHNPKAREAYLGDAKHEHVRTVALRNGSLQGAYLMLAARAAGLDCGPMSGFDHELLDKAFWDGTSVRTNFLCNLGYGDHAKLFGRLPRLTFEECCGLA